MRLDARALVEIIEILRRGLTEGTDISEMLKALDFQARDDYDGSVYSVGTLSLTQEYLDRKRG